MKCTECGEVINDGGSQDLTAHDYCCFHEHVEDVERSGYALLAYCTDCGTNLIGDEDGWEIYPAA